MKKLMLVVLAVLLASTVFAACTATESDPVGIIDRSEQNVQLSVDKNSAVKLEAIGSSPYKEITITLLGTMPMRADVKMDSIDPYVVKDFPHHVVDGIRLEAKGSVLVVWFDTDKWE